MTQEQFEEQWQVAGGTLQPLANALKEMKVALIVVKPEDFETPNHYAKLVSQQLQVQLIDRILSLLPDTVDK